MKATAKFEAGTVRMSNDTRRTARRATDGTVEFATSANANATRGKSWRTATAKQAKTFEVA